MNHRSFALVASILAGTTAAHAGELIAIEWQVFSSQPGEFHTIRTVNGAATPIGQPQTVCSFEWTGMAWDPIGDRMLVSGACAVFEVDITNGLVTPLFSWGISPMDDEQIFDGDIAVHPTSGDLYAAGPGTSGLWRVPLSGPSYEPIFVGNQLPSDVSGMTFLPDGTLLALSANNGGELYRVNPATSQSTLIGGLGVNFGPGTGTFWTGAPYTDIAYDRCSRTLYASAWDSLYIVDPTTGAATFVGTHGLGYDDGQTVLYGIAGMDFTN